MLQEIRFLIAWLLFFVIMSNNQAAIDDVNSIINGREDFDELSFDELIEILKTLKHHIINA